MTAKELFDVVSMFLEIVLLGVMAFVELFMGLSVALFIIDGIKAKRQHRKRKVGIKVMFIISIIISIILQVLMFLLGIYAIVVVIMASTGTPWPFT